MRLSCLLEKQAEHLGIALASLVNMLNPELILPRRKLRSGSGFFLAGRMKDFSKDYYC
jgi:predicted NBD/HSP70 family sugar kinase